jgi:hypothetical protein
MVARRPTCVPWPASSTPHLDPSTSRPDRLGASISLPSDVGREVATQIGVEVVRDPARDDGEAAPLVDMMGGDDSAYELVESRDAIASTWKALPDEERKVLEHPIPISRCMRSIVKRSGAECEDARSQRCADLASDLVDTEE